MSDADLLGQGTDAPANLQWVRKATLVLRSGARGRDLSAMHFKFEVRQMEDGIPNNCAIRVYNLSRETVREIRAEYDSVVLQAGYEKGPFGTIFAGSIKQFGLGKESARDTYLDIFAADGDVGFNFGVISATLAAGASLTDVIDKAAKAMDMPVAYKPADFAAFPRSIRGKVLFGMARDVLRDAARSADAAWSIHDGKVTLVPLTEYLPGTAVILNAQTGLVGMPELTPGGVNARCLLNPKIKVGGLIQINNDAVNRVVQQNPEDPRQYNSWRDINIRAQTNADGLYQAFAVEHSGDTRGLPWWSELTMLSVDSSTGKVKAYG